MSDAVKFSLTLSLIALIAGLFLGGVNFLVNPRIEAQKQQAVQSALEEVLPLDFGGFFEPVEEDGHLLYWRAYAGSDKSKIAGYVFKAEAKGYSSVIETMVGVRPDFRISGLKILSQNETPGLGARIEERRTSETIFTAIKNLFRQKREPAKKVKPWFQEQFKGKQIKELELKEGRIEAITGATISSEAVLQSVREKALEILKAVRKSPH
jgi:electron transport complex protein RnfG